MSSRSITSRDPYERVPAGAGAGVTGMGGGSGSSVATLAGSAVGGSEAVSSGLSGASTAPTTHSMITKPRPVPKSPEAIPAAAIARPVRVPLD